MKKFDEMNSDERSVVLGHISIIMAIAGDDDESLDDGEMSNALNVAYNYMKSAHDAMSNME